VPEHVLKDRALSLETDGVRVRYVVTDHTEGFTLCA
jgi:hypothetical protein